MFLRDLLELHPHADRKVGIGVSRMWVEIGRWRKPQPHLERPDGSTTDWSFKKCLRPQPPDHDFKAACRTAIVPQKLSFRDRAFGNADAVRCAITGEMVTRTECHVDHAPPATFAVLVSEFIAKETLDVVHVEVLGHADGDVERRLADAGLARRWCEFHAARWRPRITSAKANLSALKAGRSGRRAA